MAVTVSQSQRTLTELQIYRGALLSLSASLAIATRSQPAIALRQRAEIALENGIRAREGRSLLLRCDACGMHSDLTTIVDLGPTFPGNAPRRVCRDCRLKAPSPGVSP